MGKSDDPMAVLDEELFVRGVTNLRIADASVVPRLMGGHPQMAVYGIGEKAADMIKMKAKTAGAGLGSIVSNLKQSLGLNAQ